MRFGIVGCGLIGRKRAMALPSGHCVTMVADLDPTRTHALAADIPGCSWTNQWQEVVASTAVDALIVAVTHDALAPVTLAALEHGKHVLVEKPAARNAAELEAVLSKARQSGLVVKAGYNHRFHPSILKAREIVDSGALGPLMFIRGRYGHGGRKGYESEWRTRKAISGGGELIDQGTHLIDLARWFLGDFDRVFGITPKAFWDIEVDDNCFMALQTPASQVAWLHASWSEWKNMFSLEIYGRDGKLQLEGLGGSYGIERVTHYHMLPEMGPPETTSWEYPFPDRSWHREMAHFIDAVEQGFPPMSDLNDALAVLRIVEEIYKESHS